MLSIIIVGWNCAPTIGACLDSIAAHPPGVAFEVIYVDNASTDASATIVAGHAIGARVLRNAENVGFQRGNNQALAVARGDEILLLNPDTELLEGSLDALFGFMRARPDVGAASPRCVFPDGSVQWTVAPFPGLPIVKAWFWRAHPGIARLAGRSTPTGAPQQHPPTSCQQDYAYGACFATRREVVDAVGPMDEAFFLTGGEVAWSREIQDRGWQIYYVAESTIVHRESAARGQRSWLSELDWVHAHRRLLYRYDGTRAGIVGDLLFTTHLAAQGVNRVLRRGPRALPER